MAGQRARSVSLAAQERRDIQVVARQFSGSRRGCRRCRSSCGIGAGTTQAHAQAVANGLGHGVGRAFAAVHQLADENDFKVVCYGHAGDGNLHVRLNHPKHKNSYNNPEIHSILKELFQIVKSLGGTISGEHGIGLIQKNFLPIVISEANLDLQKSIKKTIDPRNIMNPGKIF